MLHNDVKNVVPSHECTTYQWTARSNVAQLIFGVEYTNLIYPTWGTAVCADR